MRSNDNNDTNYDDFEMSLNDFSNTAGVPNRSSATQKRRRKTIAAASPAKNIAVEEKLETPDIEEEDDFELDNESPVKPEPQPEKKKPAKKAGPKKSLRQRFVESRLAIFIGVVLLILAAYSLMSIISFISTNNQDQSIVTNNSFHEILNRSDEIKNTGGPAGAWLSNFVLSQWLGLGSLALIIYFVILAISLLRLRPCKFWSLTFKSLVSAIAISIIAGALCMLGHHTWFWGGEHGFMVNEFMLKVSRMWGDIALNIVMLAALILIFYDTLRKIVGFFASRISNYREKMRLNSTPENENEDDDDDEEEEEEEEEEENDDSANEEDEEEDEADVDDSESAPEDLEAEEPTHSMLGGMLKGSLLTVPGTSGNSEFELSDNPEDSADTSADPVVEVEVGNIEKADKIQTDVYDPTAELSLYKLPPIDLLKKIEQKSCSVDQEEIEENKERLTRTLRSYGVEIQSIKATVGPTITLYEIVPAEGIRIAKIKNLGNDMALNLSAMGIRIIAPMPGKGTIGMEVPNKDKQIVSIRSVLSSQAYQESKAALPIAMGTTISNDVYVTDLAKMPHLLVAGATGMGKSVGLNTIIASLLYKKHPAELKFVLIDPKMVEFSLYNVLEHHFLAKLPNEEEPIITDPSKVLDTLNSLCVEMDERYRLLKLAGERDIKGYNAMFIERRLNPNNGHRFLPYIVVIVDEFADLITTAGKEIEAPISRLAAKARAIGIHVILATQRPSVNVITGVIKANFPGRIAFRVNQMNDSRTILDRPGADQLIGRGDMIISKDGVMERVQCALIETDEVKDICNFISSQIGYDSAYELPEYIPPTEFAGGAGGGGAQGDRDPLFAEAGRFIIDSGIGSTTAIQRHFNVGFPRAGKIMDQLEMAGVVGPTQGGKPRKVLMDQMAFDDLIYPNHV